MRGSFGGIAWGAARAKTTRRGSTLPTTTTGPSMPCSPTRSAASPAGCAPWTSRWRARRCGRDAGREAVRLVGVPRERWDWGWDPDPLSWGADEYEVVVDAERGVLLRCASRLGGKDFDALEVEEIHFDERFPEDTFSSRQPLPWGR